jgi:tetratricopeptide (TPR) repeat protein
LRPANASAASKALVLVGRAKAYRETGDAARAAADAAEAHRLDPNSAAAFDGAQARRAGRDPVLEQKLKDIEALWDDGEDDRALAEVSRLIAANPGSAKAYALRASIYLARQENDRATPDITQATSLSKNCQLNLRVRATISGEAASGRQSYPLTCPD